MANSYFTCTLNVSVNGNSISAYMNYKRSQTFTYTDSSFPTPTMTIAGTTYNDTSFRDKVRSGINVGNVNTTTFTKSGLANGTYTVTFKAGAGGRSDFEGTWSKSVTINVSTAPSNLKLDIVTATWNSVTLDSTVGNWGSGSNALRGVYLLQEPYVAGVNKYREESTSTSTSPVRLTVSSSSPYEFDNNPFPVLGCTMYHTGMIAVTSAGDVRLQGKTFYTAPAPLVSFANVTTAVQTSGLITANMKAVLNSSDNRSGARIGIQYRYSSDGGVSYTSWINASNVYTVSASSTDAPFDISGLMPSTTYIVEVRQYCVDATEVFYSETKSTTFETPTIQEPTLDYSWNDTRDTLSLHAETSSANNSGIDIVWGYNTSMDNVAATTSVGAIDLDGTIQYPNHGSNDYIYAEARVKVGSNFVPSQRLRISVPNPILGIATMPDGTQKYIVDIVEQKKDGTLTTRWKNGKRVTKK